MASKIKIKGKESKFMTGEKLEQEAEFRAGMKEGRTLRRQRKEENATTDEKKHKIYKTAAGITLKIVV